MFVPGRPFKPSLMFVDKAGRLTNYNNFQVLHSGLARKHCISRKHSSSLQKPVNYGHKKFYNIRPCSAAWWYEFFPLPKMVLPLAPSLSRASTWGRPNSSLAAPAALYRSRSRSVNVAEFEPCTEPTYSGFKLSNWSQRFKTFYVRYFQMLECLSLVNLSSLTQWLWVRPRAYPKGDLF